MEKTNNVEGEGGGERKEQKNVSNLPHLISVYRSLEHSLKHQCILISPQWGKSRKHGTMYIYKTVNPRNSIGCYYPKIITYQQKNDIIDQWRGSRQGTVGARANQSKNVWQYSTYARLSTASTWCCDAGCMSGPSLPSSSAASPFQVDKSERNASTYSIRSCQRRAPSPLSTVG